MRIALKKKKKKKKSTHTHLHSNNVKCSAIIDKYFQEQNVTPPLHVMEPYLITLFKDVKLLDICKQVSLKIYKVVPLF